MLPLPGKDAVMLATSVGPESHTQLIILELGQFSHRGELGEGEGGLIKSSQ